ncbi:FimV/HubP family polar landmark protein [Aliivibrio wodanis]|uniref:FimV/HubP family polar landmark protein n=1 Tax=Aliivibrio wodanis TaxID=80852 RepID=UPI00406BFE6B
MSDASKKLLKTLTPLALFVASQCSVANAAGTIQIVGPEGKDQTVSSQVVTQSQPTRAATVTKSTAVQERKASTSATKVYGPTRDDETLWSIASRMNPSNTTTVQQTLLAIYRLNPQAFENNNIHGLEPNSRLRLPTLEQVRRENTDDAKQLLIAHKNKQNAQKSVSTKTTKAVLPESKLTPAAKETTVSPSKEKAAVVNKSPVKEVSKTAAPASVIELKSELDTTEQEFSALQENNHQLRVRLAEVQNEVDNLKNSLGDEDRIRNEVEKFINEQKQLAVAEKKAEPSAMDNLASSPGLIALLALIPGALIAGLIAFFLSRRKKEEEDEAENTPEVQPSALVMPEDNFNMDDDIPEISLDDDDDLLGDLNDDEFLFGDDDSDSNDDLFAEFETENNSSDNDDPFASLDSEENDDLDSMLSDGDLDLDLDSLDDDIDMSSSALTVDAEEKALGLEEMEKALNDFDSDLFSASDLEEEDDDFDLSLIDDSDLSTLDKSTPELKDNEDLEGGELDQSMLDDLFSSMDMEDDSEGSELDQGWDLDEKEETKLAPEPISNSIEDELDFDTLLSEMEDTNKLAEESNKEDSIELDNEDALFGELDEESIDLESDKDSATLLDELLDESDDKESIALDIEDDSTALLDELLDESDDEEDIDLDIEDDSTALLDELLGDDEELSQDDDDIEIDEDSTALLDEFLADEDETIELDEDSTVLLDELLGDDVGRGRNYSGKEWR